jgi:hypothetical protein
MTLCVLVSDAVEAVWANRRGQKDSEARLMSCEIGETWCLMQKGTLSLGLHTEPDDPYLGAIIAQKERSLQILSGEIIGYL